MKTKIFVLTCDRKVSSKMMVPEEEMEELVGEVTAMKFMMRLIKQQLRDARSRELNLMAVNTKLMQELRESKQRERLLMGTVNTLVQDWLTPDQRASLQNKDATYQEKKKLTLARKNERDQRSI